MFKIIGELINTTRKNIKEAAAKKDVAFIQRIVNRQIEAGAEWIDVNGGGRAGHEQEDMDWLLDVVQEVSGDTPLSLDSPDPKVLAMAYKKVNVRPMINSISLESTRWNSLLSFLKGKECDVIALCMDDTGLPKSVEDIVSRTERIVSGLTETGVSRDSIYIDPIVQPISTDITKGKMALLAVSKIMERFAGIHTTSGLSNISFGNPKRRLINRFFLSMMIAYGLDSAILDPLDQKMIEAIKTADMLAGNDPYCRNFLNAVRAGVIVD
jgi:5-methyltetrahydrofolate--homocysteine methyltransferase